MDKEIITTTDAAKLLGVSVRTAQLLLEGGAIPSWKTPGGHRRVYREDVMTVISHHDTPPTLSSALVVLLTRPERSEAYVSAMAGVAACTVDSYSDVHPALFAIGLRLPAAIVIETEGGDAQRSAAVPSLIANPKLGHTHVIVVGSYDEESIAGEGRAREALHLVDGLAALPKVLRAVLHDRAAETSPFATPPSFPISEGEGRRLLALERSGILDTAPEDAFDRLTWLAARSLDMPIALITILTSTRQWFKSRYGLEVPETPRSWSFCNHTILQSEVLMFEDLALDGRFVTHPAVAGGPRFRFYAGHPIVDPDGFALGSLCVMDTRPRALGQEQRRLLASLADLASDQIQLRVTDRRLHWALEALERRR